jgi:hypothetical protein
VKSILFLLGKTKIRVDVLKEVEMVYELSLLKKLTKYHFWFPWPLSDRQCLIAFSAFPLLDRKALMITMRTPQEGGLYYNREIPEAKNGEVRMKINLGCLYAESVGDGMCKIVFVVSADGNIVSIIQRFLPNWLVNYGTKTIMYYLMAKLRDKMEHVEGSVYEDRMRNRPGMYEMMKNAHL